MSRIIIPIVTDSAEEALSIQAIIMRERIAKPAIQLPAIEESVAPTLHPVARALDNLARGAAHQRKEALKPLRFERLTTRNWPPSACR